MSTREYHLRELAIAQSPDDPRHILPPIGPRHRQILDVGCGAGQTLLASDLAPGAQAVGIDVDFEALVLGTELAPQVAFTSGSAERLPFADGSFDLVIARVVLPLTHIPSAVAEIGRVLQPGGDVWMTLHPLSRTLHNLAGNVRHVQPKHLLYRSYVLVNGTLFHLTGVLVASPLNGRYESFQTDAGIGRELRRAGFENVRAEHRKHYVVTATKR